MSEDEDEDEDEDENPQRTRTRKRPKTETGTGTGTKTQTRARSRIPGGQKPQGLPHETRKNEMKTEMGADSISEPKQLVEERDSAQKHTLFVLILSQVIGAIGLGVAPSIGILLAGEVTDSETWAGLARTAGTLGAAVMGIPLGNLAARRGRRVALTTGWGVATLGGAVLILASQWSLVVPLFVGLFLFGAGSAGSLQARFAATDLATPKNKAKSLSLVVWVGTIGMVLGPNLGTPGEFLGGLTGLTTYASAFLIATVFSLIAGIIVFAMLRPDPMLLSDKLAAEVREEASRASGSASPSPASSSIGRLPKPKQGAISGIALEMKENARARTAVIAIIIAQVVMVSIMTMTPVHIVNQGGSVHMVGITISLHIMGMFAFAPVVGMLTDRYGNRATMLWGSGILLVSLVLGMAVPDSMAGVLVSLILLGLGWSFVNVSASALFARVVSSDRRASSQGGVDAMSNLFGATAAFIAGPLMAFTGFAMLSVVAFVFMIPLVVLLMTPVAKQIGDDRVG